MGLLKIRTIYNKAHKTKHYSFYQSACLLIAVFAAFFILPAWVEAAEIKQVQTGTVTLSATSQRITIKPVVDNKSLLVFNLLADRTTAGPQDTHLRGQLSCTDGRCDAIDFKRYGSNGRVKLRWQVIEFSSDSLITVQRGIETQLGMTNTPPQKIIKTGVDPSKSFVLLSEFVSGGVSDATAFTRGQINAVGDLVLTVGGKRASISQAEIAWQVIEYRQAVVQTGDLRFERMDESKTVAINRVDLNKAWLVYNYYSTAEGAAAVNPVCQNLVSGAMINETSLQFNRGCANKNGTLHVSWFVIGFTDETLVQQNVLSFAAHQSKQTTTLAQAVDARCAVTHLGYHQRGGQSSAMTDHTASAWFYGNLNKAGTELTLQRGQTNNAIAELGWSVLSFAGCGSGTVARDYGDAPLSGIAADGVNKNRYGAASHKLVRGMYLGFSNPDAEPSYQSSLNAGGDDRRGIDDDDILSMSSLAQGEMAAFTIFASGKRGYLQAWIDFDGNGVFDQKEQIATNLQDNGMGDDAIARDGTIVFKTAIPPNTTLNQTYARFRWSTTKDLNAVTAAKDGEVEDYAVTITASAANLATAKKNEAAKAVIKTKPTPQAQKELQKELQEKVAEPTQTALEKSDSVSQSPTQKTQAPQSKDGTDKTTAIGSTTDQSASNKIVESEVLDADDENKAIASPVTTDNKDESKLEQKSQPRRVSITGRVYNDSNVNGQYDTQEVGVSALPVVLFDIANKTCVSTRTDANGYYQFADIAAGEYQLYEASREKVPVPRKCGIAYAKDPIAYRSTTVNVLAPFTVTDTDINGKDFADVKAPVFSPNHNDKVQANNIRFYRHTLMPKSSGTVDFTVSNNTPASSGWSSALYHDTNCNGDLSKTEAKMVLSDTLVAQPNKAICLINKVVVPNDVVNGETYSNMITARFDFAHKLAGVIKRTVKDRSKVAVVDKSVNKQHDASGDVQYEPRLELKKTVENLTQGTAETDTQQQVTTGDILQYRIYYSNTGNGVISELVINDIIPEFATLSAVPVCEKPLPKGLTKCVPSVNGRDIHWEFPSTDSLQTEQHGVVSYQVKVGE